MDYIDGYKTDSQGTDLRIFNSLPKEIINKILLAEFEPGIIDAYQGEDKLHHLLAHMEKEPFLDFKDGNQGFTAYQSF